MVSLQTRTSSNSGSTWTDWSDTTSCTWDKSGSSRRDCRYEVAAWNTWGDASSCTPQAINTNTSNGQTWKPGVACQYTGWTDWTNATSSALPFRKTLLGRGTSLSLVNANTPLLQPPEPVNNCTSASKSGGSPYTTLVATTCSYSSYSTWENTDNCTAQAEDTSSPYTIPQTTNCQYTNWTGWTTTNACTPVAKSTVPNYTVGTAVECQTLSSGGINTLADVAALLLPQRPAKRERNGRRRNRHLYRSGHRSGYNRLRFM